MLEGIFGRLVGVVLDLVGARVASRPKLKMRCGTTQRLVGGTGTAYGIANLYSQDGTLLLHNSGLSRFTVNEAGWEGKDGTRLKAGPDTPETREPGGGELVLHATAKDLLAFHDAHDGITRSYIILAGESKPRYSRIRPDWFDELRVAAERPTEKRS